MSSDQTCLFCGGKIKISKRRTGTEWAQFPSKENHWHGKVVDRYRYQVLCNKCKARGPLAKSEQEARDVYKLHTSHE
mgnify:CR=1 FL=1